MGMHQSNKRCIYPTILEHKPLIWDDDEEKLTAYRPTS
jgi:hypothetical protein